MNVSRLNDSQNGRYYLVMDNEMVVKRKGQILKYMAYFLIGISIGMVL